MALSQDRKTSNVYQYVEFDVSNSRGFLAQNLENNQYTFNHPNFYDSMYINFARLGVKPFWKGYFKHRNRPSLTIIVRPHNSEKLVNAIRTSSKKYFIIIDTNDLIDRNFCEMLFCQTFINEESLELYMKTTASKTKSIDGNNKVYQLDINGNNIYITNRADFFQGKAQVLFIITQLLNKKRIVKYRSIFLDGY